MSKSRTILIVDDDPDFVRAVTRLFEAQGDTVFSSPNGEKGIAVARATHPDLILLDVMMRERTEGFFALDAIRRDPALRDTPVIVLSSIYTEYPLFKVDPKAGWLPADAFLAKPVEPRALLDEASRVIAAARERQLARSVAR